MTDAPGGAGPCVRGWAKGVPDRDDIRSAHWTVTPIIPIHRQPPLLLPAILSHHNMSYENVADFQEFMDAGREGSYSSNKENNCRIVAFWLSVPTNAIVHSPSSERRSQGQGSRPVASGSHVVRYPRTAKTVKPGQYSCSFSVL